MLLPKRVKHRKQMKGRMKGEACRRIDISFGEFALQAAGAVGLTTARSEQLGQRDPLYQAGW